MSGKTDLASQHTSEAFQRKLTEIVRNAELFEMVSTNDPNIMCTRIPQHCRSKRRLDFYVVSDCDIRDGTLVTVKAASDTVPEAIVENGEAIMMSGVAQFKGMRFLSYSGRGTPFSVTICIYTATPKYVIYDDRVKVTRDGPRHWLDKHSPKSATENARDSRSRVQRKKPKSMPKENIEGSESGSDNEGDSKVEEEQDYKEANGSNDQQVFLVDQTSPSAHTGHATPADVAVETPTEDLNVDVNDEPLKELQTPAEEYVQDQRSVDECPPSSVITTIGYPMEGGLMLYKSISDGLLNGELTLAMTALPAPSGVDIDSVNPEQLHPGFHLHVLPTARSVVAADRSQNENDPEIEDDEWGASTSTFTLR